MAVKLIAVDLDGTLLTSGNTISPETLRTLQVAHGMGVKIVLASGRPLSGVMPFIIKQGRDNSLYLVNSQKINSLQEGIEQYYNSKSNRTEKIPFIYIKQSENETTKVDIDGKNLKLIYGEGGKTKEQKLSSQTH